MIRVAVAAFALVALTGPLRAEPRATTATELAANVPAPKEPPGSAEAPAPRESALDALPLLPSPEVVHDLLPPGVRPASERARVLPIEGGAGRFVVERVDNPDPEGAAPDWFEVEYSVDPDLEARIREILRRGHVPLGNVVLMDPESGRVFAYVSSDPEVFPATRPYPTASLMKVVTAAAVLRNAPAAAERSCRYLGSPWELHASDLEPPRSGGHVQSFQRAVAMSNNQCFARLAIRDVGAEALVAEMQRVGLLEPPAPGHPAGRVRPVHGKLELAYLGSGMAGSFVTPLAAVRLAAAVARGELVEPWWIARVRDARGAALAPPRRRPARSIWPREIVDPLREAMVGVTEEGTAARAFHRPDGSRRLGAIRVAAKTGTLSGTEPPGRYQWFIGLAPAEAPRVAIAVVVVNDPRGGRSASEIGADTLEALFCDGGRCAPAQVEGLYARVSAREHQSDRELTRERARERERAERAAQRTAALLAAAELDAPPKPVGVSGFDFPRALRARPVEGRIVLQVELDRDGEVLDVAVASSDLPDFDAFVTEQVRSWRFTPPTRMGQPVQARARLPIAIQIQ